MKILTNYDFSQNQILNVVVQKLAVPPANPVSGQIYFNTAKKRLFYFDGVKWEGSDALDAVMSGADIVDAINSSDSTISVDRLTQAVRDAIQKAHDTHSISDVTGLQSALDGKVDDSQVLTNVPINAEFTDTITTINGKTGEISKADIVALGIPAQDTTYTHPSTHPASMITESATKRFVTDAEKSTWNAKETPSGATAKASTAENNAKGYTDSKIADLIGSAPETLDTLHEIAEALGEDPNFATTILDRLAEKTKKYVASVGDGTKTSFVLTHNLNTRDVNVMIRQTASPYAMVMTDVEMTTVDTITVKFAEAPASSEYTVTIIG